MSVRVLIIDDRVDFRRLLCQHVSTGFDSPSIAEYDPAARGRLPGDFSGSAYDAVLLGDTPGSDEGLSWLKDLSRRSGFPPIIYLLSETSTEAEEQAIAAGARATLSGRKIDHVGLVDALRAAQARSSQPARPTAHVDDSPRATRFGEVSIRGYRCINQIADTPMSSVYLAESDRSGKQVVLKVLHQPPDDGGVKSFERFLREYQIAADIEHPTVARVHDFGVADDHAFIAMEYFPLGDLRGRIRNGIEPLRALTYLRQMAEALTVLHGAGVLHRDLKPGNVMLRDESSVALIDYGLSKHIDIDASLSDVGEIFGTPYYMSPEQGHGKDTDARSDIYSLGIIFYEMLMLRKPYVAATPMQVIYKHANSPLPELRAAMKRFEGLLYNCIAKDPSRRYGSAEQLLDAARELERDENER